MKNANHMDDVLNFINGEYRESSDGKTFKNFAPATGQLNSLIHEASQQDVDDAVKAAKAALNGPWGKMTVAQRTEMIIAVADEIDNRFEEFLAAEIADTGKPESLAKKIDIPRGAANFRMFVETIRSEAGEMFEMPTPDGAGALNYSLRKPRGVIAVICPWNLPLLLMTWKVGPALACGNTVVVKPSEETPRTAALLGEVMNKVGIPKGVYNVVNGFGGNSAGQFLTENPDIDGITFTGETKTGQLIMKAAATGVRNVSLELGGKNPGIIFADADMDKAIEGTMRSAFVNCGQVCLGTERLYVERPIFDEFVARLKAGAEKLKLGAPDDKTTDLGPLISEEHRTKVLSYYKKAVDEGATVITGGGAPKMSGELENGYWVEPTIWTNVADDASIVTDEIFGPCCVILPFDDEAEAIERANNTAYGLAATVWTENLSKAHRVSASLNVGICWVNSWFLRDLRTPFGGSKGSGIGREGGVHSLEFYTELKNICIKL